MANRKNIVLAANDVTQIGGISRVIHAMAEGFSRRGYSVTLLGMNAAEASISYVGGSDQSGNYPVVVPYSERPPARNVDLARWSWLRGEAVGYMRCYLDSIDVSDTILIALHVYVMEHLLETGVSIGARNGLGVIGMYHSSFEACREVGDLKRVKQSFAAADRFLALTEEDRDGYAAAGLTNASFIYNPVALLTSPPVMSWQERERRIVYVGRLAPGKNVERLVEHWASVAPHFPEWTFEIYGSGPCEESVARAILDWGVADSVRLMGATQNPEVVFSTSRLMVMASDFEGLPVAIVEAAMCGLPVLSVDSSPGIRVLVENGRSGFVVDPRDRGGFVARLSELLSDDQMCERFGAEGRQRMEMFDVDQVIDDWEDIFAECGL